ncbi:hypothetical protein [Nostoc sp. FACHB-133]|uniref:hypothetical protein n=1 Tax=Nostoc sp. FACHB-133 TaxID=2692835 RepID=UPI00168338D4|nr:hypothetical protein [Nostoc sp. FACHB-133]MBD2527154.1 hypothetical protein [Nostoc sp. FACHB-133]
MSNNSNTVSTSLDNQSHHHYDVLRQQIDDSLKKAETQKNKLKTIERRYSIINICLGALATFITGQSAVSNDPLIGNWRINTTVASVLTLGVTIVGSMQKQLAAPDLLSEASECVAKLKALKVETIVSTYDTEQVSEEYQQILSDFSKIDC